MIITRPTAIPEQSDSLVAAAAHLADDVRAKAIGRHYLPGTIRLMRPCLFYAPFAVSRIIITCCIIRQS